VEQRNTILLASHHLMPQILPDKHVAIHLHINCTKRLNCPVSHLGSLDTNWWVINHLASKKTLRRGNKCWHAEGNGKMGTPVKH
jgi:hypothetical protein